MKLRDELFSEFKGRPLWIGCDIVHGNLRCVGEQKANTVYTTWLRGFYKKNDNHVCVTMGLWSVGHFYAVRCSLNRFVICEMPYLVPTYCTSLGPDGRIARRCLHGHDIKNLTATGVSECGQACWAEPRCRSFNLWQGGPGTTCQLNNATRNKVSPGTFYEQGRCTYFTLGDGC